MTKPSDAPTNAVLQGLGVVIIRPAHQSARLAELIAASGGNPILFPTLEIVATEPSAALDALIAKLDDFDIAIFISANAVDQALPLIKSRRELPPSLKVAAIGAASAEHLRHFGVSDVIVPDRYDSEAMLKLAQLKNVSGKRIVIFRGEGGRETLAEGLKARGADVQYAQCYRRARPRHDATALLEMWRSGGVDAVTASSAEALRNLCAMLEASGVTWLGCTPLFVPHRRIEDAARELGLKEVVLTEQGDSGLVRGLSRWFVAPRDDPVYSASRTD